MFYYEFVYFIAEIVNTVCTRIKPRRLAIVRFWRYHNTNIYFNSYILFFLQILSSFLGISENQGAAYQAS